MFFDCVMAFEELRVPGWVICASLQECSRTFELHMQRGWLKIEERPHPGGDWSFLNLKPCRANAPAKPVVTKAANL
tara:strand:- start:196 stop:423 length:228 start_codon:yes stop_codon:yes gene_type:complete